MNYIPEQTINDLEFDLIRLMLHDNCICETAQLRMVDLMPLSDRDELTIELHRVNDLKAIRTEKLTFPALDFEEISEELENLNNKHNVLTEESFMRVKQLSELVNRILGFFSDKKERFSYLTELSEHIYENEDIIKAINRVFDARGNVKDDASPQLAKIRSEQKSVRNQVNSNFDKQVRSLLKKGILADNNETFLYGKRVLSVVSSYKRSVTGNALGSSKTGNVTFIEPSNNIPLNHELEMLKDDERSEIFRILKELTLIVREHLPLLQDYQEFITELDFINAKTKLALQLNANLPVISNETELELINAYHPILLVTNQTLNKETKPQSLLMNKFNRMLVISGPNAGGKSITLKTIGLLQLMFQSGLLVPTEPHSKMSMFNHILTDIGDNQSIENQLSTYSYRLKRMKEFLERANRKTLILLDEFGTGSDPELGGAMAEVFFEELYNKKAFGVITTHYSNIKLKADKLQNAVNCCMLFNQETLEPTFKLSVGMPGSSFTFEVAEKNGIPKQLIEKAKSKLDSKKVDMDKLLSALQKEKAEFEHLNSKSKSSSEQAKKAELKFQSKAKSLDEKIATQREVTEANNQLITKGKKLSQFVSRFDTRAKNKELLADVRKYLAMEKTKIMESKKAETLRRKAQAKADAKKNIVRQTDNQKKIGVGSKVRLIGAKKTGEVIAKEGHEVTVLFGNLKTKISVQKLRYVK
ncbi:MAG: MutS2/Smr-associated SH3 domain-containing protein [Flavobacteriales bacterium]